MHGRREGRGRGVSRPDMRRSAGDGRAGPGVVAVSGAAGAAAGGLGTGHGGAGGTPLILLANFASPLAVDLEREAVVGRWSEQAPRELWQARPGDVLVSPVPLSEAFVDYAHRTLAMAPGAVEVLTVPDRPGRAMAETVRMSAAAERLRTFARARLAPIALDTATFDLADALGVSVAPLGRTGPAVERHVVPAVSAVNTKTGFRSGAADAGVRLPFGRACSGAELPDAVRDVLADHPEAVIKPDRSAGGIGMRFTARGAPPPAVCGAGGRWVVEAYVPHSACLSAQFAVTGHSVTGGGVVPLFDGVMDTDNCVFTGYRSPLPDTPGLRAARADLLRWGRALGARLAAQGYAGPLGVDALLGHDGLLHATESNVRRTATTAPYELVRRLTAQGGHGGSATAGTDGSRAAAWLTATADAAAPLDFPEALRLLDARGLAYDPTRREGVVLYADRPADGAGWRYLALSPQPARLDALREATAAAFRDPRRAPGTAFARAIPARPNA